MDKKEIFDRIEYVVACVGAFAQRYGLSNMQAYAYCLNIKIFSDYSEGWARLAALRDELLPKLMSGALKPE